MSTRAVLPARAVSPTREVWHPRWWAWSLLGLLALALARLVDPKRLQGHWLFITPLLIVAGIFILRRLWERPPAATMCAAIALTIFSGAWHRIGLGGLPLDRLLILIVLLQFILRAPGVAHVPPLQIRNVHLLLCVAAMYALASALAAGTLSNELSLLALIDVFGIVPFAMFLLAPAVFSGRRERDMLLATLVGLGAYLGLTAIFESLGPHGLVFPRYILHIDAELPGERAGGPFQSSVAEGFATFACAIAAIMAYAQWRGQKRRYLAAIVTVVCIFGCFLTLERGVWIGAAAGIVVMALATRTGRRWLIPGVLACTLVIGGALLFSSTLATKTSHRTDDQLSIWTRENQIFAGLRMLDARPLLGFGWNKYPTESLGYFREAADYPMDGYSEPASCASSGGGCTFEVPRPLHNTYLSFAVELGLIGGLLWLVSLLWGVALGIFSRGPADLRPWKLGLIAITIAFLAIAAVNPFQSPFTMLLLWVWAGIAWGNSSPSLRKRRADIALRTRGEVAWAPS
jgi:putative inorganic carbon (hco3(-)) transporter